MRRLAWWAISIGLTLKFGFLVNYAVGSDMGVGYRALAAADSIGYTLFIGGAILLAATVIADAIAKAQGTRESP